MRSFVPNALSCRILIVFVGTAVGMGCGGGDGSQGPATGADRNQDPTPGAPVGDRATPEEFVGKVARGRELVAVALGQEKSDGQAKVTAFVCGEGRRAEAEWFTSSSSKRSLGLTSQTREALLSVDLTGRAAIGSVTLKNGARRDTFKGDPARSGAGLYEITVTADGATRGTSRGGAKLDGRISGGLHEGTIDVPGGNAVKFRTRQTNTDNGRDDSKRPKAGRYTVIVLSEGKDMCGRGARVKRGRPASEFVWHASES